jgi:hypothetical protein
MSRIMGVVLVGCLGASALGSARPEKSKVKIWCGISVSEPVLVLGRDKQLCLHLGLVNDGDRVVDPQLGATELLINGKPLEGWDFTINQGLRHVRATALPAGDSLGITFDLTRHFQKEGVYKVRWKGVDFESSEIVFRVVSEKRS